ncbi:MAG: dephospho-CoA kinase [Flammeovirgaceae bacterium]|nr:dephospho-CoA kinase [Flammeovirgaceae bacterium]MBP9925901.1 dephospho-CoA kinase [Cyclobacteriaceae bacterium]
MRKSLQIGITGGIGAGKSLVCKIFGILGVPAYDADSRAKVLMTTDGILIEQIKKEFGSLSYNTTGELNRVFLSSEVFNQKEKLESLNSLVHPRVAIDYNQWVVDHAEHKYVIKEAALLFESGSYKAMDQTILVTASTALRIRRVLERDTHRTKSDVERIIQNQLPEAEKETMADYIIRNNESELVVPYILKLHERFNTMN